jgi:hypothetical protein
MSVDLLPSDTKGNHYQGNIFDVLKCTPGVWDLMIAFPPCTKLASIGAAHWGKWEKDGSQDDAIDFFADLTEARIPRICIENPIGIMSTLWRKPDQYIEPWWFGDPWHKKTGLWLKKLPQLEPTRVVRPKGHWVDGGTMTKRQLPRSSEGSYGQLRSKGNAGRAHVRALTFQGLANAMAEQWG